jgi:hypothetical protein
MRNPVRFAIATVVVHFAVNVLHGMAHQRLGIGLPRGEMRFVEIDIVIAPLVAGALLLTRWRRWGGWLLALSMAGAFFFGMYKHFVAAGADNALTLPASGWGTIFQITAVLITLSEAFACWAGIAAAMQEDAKEKRH